MKLKWSLVSYLVLRYIIEWLITFQSIFNLSNIPISCLFSVIGNVMRYSLLCCVSCYVTKFLEQKTMTIFIPTASYYASNEIVIKLQLSHTCMQSVLNFFIYKFMYFCHILDTGGGYTLNAALMCLTGEKYLNITNFYLKELSSVRSIHIIFYLACVGFHMSNSSSKNWAISDAISLMMLASVPPSSDLTDFLRLSHSANQNLESYCWLKKVWWTLKI